MKIVPSTTLLMLQQAIVEGTHTIVDQDGMRVHIGTIDDQRLAMAALNAITAAVGDVVWPQNKKIDLPQPRAAAGPFG